MRTPIRHLVLCTNGAPQARHALSLGGWLAERLGTDVTLLGVAEASRPRQMLDAELDRAEAQIRAAGVHLDRQVRFGKAEATIAGLIAREGTLLVVGPFGRPAVLRWLRGRSLRRLMAATMYPILYVPKPKEKVERILICLGGLQIGRPAEELALELGRRLSAQLTLIHVVETIGYDYPITREVAHHSDSLLESHTPQAKMLGEVLEASRKIDPKAELLVGHGSVVSQILTETQRCPYDLISLGSPGNAHALRQLYTPNVTAEVAELAGSPVLIGGDNAASEEPSFGPQTDGPVGLDGEI